MGLLRSSVVSGSADPFCGPSDPVLIMLLGAGMSVLCDMLGERSQVSLLLVLLKDLPHTYSCTCFFSIKEQKVETSKTPPVSIRNV
jgi:hypothetical protein